MSDKHARGSLDSRLSFLELAPYKKETPKISESKTFNDSLKLRAFIVPFCYYFAMMILSIPALIASYFLRKNVLLIHSLDKMMIWSTPLLRVIILPATSAFILFLMIARQGSVLTVQTTELVIFLAALQAANFGYLHKNLLKRIWNGELSEQEIAKLRVFGDTECSSQESLKNQIEYVLSKDNVNASLLDFKYLYLPEDSYTTTAQSGFNYAMHECGNFNESYQALLLKLGILTINVIIPIVIQVFQVNSVWSFGQFFFTIIYLAIQLFYSLGVYVVIGGLSGGGLRCINHYQDLLTRLKRLVTYTDSTEEEEQAREKDVDKNRAKLDIFDERSLKAWMLLRRVFIQIHNRTIDVIAISIVIIILPNFIAMIIIVARNYDNFLSRYKDINEAFVGLGIQFIVLMTVLLTYAFQGMLVNKEFQKHFDLIRYNRSIVIQIFERYPEFCSKKPVPDTFFFQQGFKKLNSEFGEDCVAKGKEINRKLKSLLRAYDDLLDDLKYDEAERPFKLLRVAVSPKLIGGLIVSLVPVMVTTALKSIFSAAQNQNGGTPEEITS